MGENLTFDLETKMLADEVGGWSNIDKMGFAAGVTYSHEKQNYDRFAEQQVGDLITLINQATMVIGFNLIRFDFVVLQPYGLSVDDQLKAKSLDMLQHIFIQLGFRVSLNNLANATLGETKNADGIASVRWYKAGEMERVFAYCEQDVRVTHALWEYGREHKHLLFRDRRGARVEVPVDW